MKNPAALVVAVVVEGGSGRKTPETLKGPVGYALVCDESSVIATLAPTIGVPSAFTKVPLITVDGVGRDIGLPMILDFGTGSRAESLRVVRLIVVWVSYDQCRSSGLRNQMCHPATPRWPTDSNVPEYTVVCRRPLAREKAADIVTRSSEIAPVGGVR